MQIKPYSSPYKIYIIDEADKLTVAAQNAMLKTIEEPPAYGIVILLANNPDVFLQTILSRCVVLDLKPLKDDVVIKYLKDHYDNIRLVPACCLHTGMAHPTRLNTARLTLQCLCKCAGNKLLS